MQKPLTLGWHKKVLRVPLFAKVEKAQNFLKSHMSSEHKLNENSNITNMKFMIAIFG